MPLTVNLRPLENRNLELRGELSLAELQLGLHDALIRLTHPLVYDLEIELLDDALLVQGSLQITLECHCVRCLKIFEFDLTLDPWTKHLPFEPLEDEDSVIITNDSVDLTPVMREDIILEFPQHPLCRPDCSGLMQASADKTRKIAGPTASKPAAWSELNKLKL